MRASAIPAELLAHRQWVAYRPEQRGEKITKIPLNPANGREASSTDPATWGTYAQAQERAATIRGGGIGYVFSVDDGYTGFDLDGCRDSRTGQIAMWAQEIVRHLDSYAEISPSGEGVHIIARARKPGNRCKVTTPHVIEMYDRDRFFTVTGNHLDGTPETIEIRQDQVEDSYRRLFPEVASERPAAPCSTISMDDTELIEKAMAARNGPAFTALWAGETSNHNGDDSAADLALCSHLAFWTGNNPARMDRLFRQSGLYRAKWERSDYREATLEKAMAAEVYTERRKAAEPTPIRPDAEDIGIERRLNEVANAARFVRQHGEKIRYCKVLDTWFIWDGTRWRPDETGAIMQMAKATAASIYHEAADAPEAMREEVAKWARRSHFRAGLTAMVALAQSDPAVAIRPTDLDRDRWVLNCINGTLDLRTGELRPHDPHDLITKLAPVTYDAAAVLPLWDTFLAETTGGDERFAAFLGRAAGCTLVGENLDEVIFLPHGPAATGKSSLLEAFKSTLGDYAKTADFETFLKKRGDSGVRNDIARLAGTRFVVSIEVDEGKQLALALLKTLSGGEDVSARFLYHEAFEYRPAFTLWLAANHAPEVRPDDDAAWRRILRLPFTNIVPKEKRDPQVKATLRDPSIAGAAILAWAMRGCLEWQRDGLNLPAVVEQATATYRREMNPIADFVDAYCDLSPQSWTATERLWGAYQAWENEEGPAKTLAKKDFTDHLKALGCTADLRRWQGKVSRGWKGIAFKDDDTPRGDSLPIDPEGVTPKKEALHPNTLSTQGGTATTPEGCNACNGSVGKSKDISTHKGELPTLPLQALQTLHPPDLPANDYAAGDVLTPVSPLAQKLIAWATNVLADDWPDGEPPAWVVNLMHECDIEADITSEKATAARISAALKGGAR